MKAIIKTGLGIIEQEVILFSTAFNLIPSNPNTEELNQCGCPFIITARGEVYISNDTPNYCDGENRVEKFVES